MKINSKIILIIAVAMILGISGGIVMYKNNTKKIGRANIIENKIINEVSELITDECIEEWEELDEASQLEIEANSREEKISPNCFITLKKTYSKCEHCINEYIEIPESLVNKTEDELQNEYSDWKIEKFSSNDIILSKIYNGECGQHFLLKSNDGKIVIYKIDENNNENIYEETEISVEYLTDEDKVKIQNGIRVNGKEDLNQLIEDFE